MGDNDVGEGGGGGDAWVIMMLGRRGLWRGCIGDNDVRGGGG